MATYAEIQDYCRQFDGRVMQTCWIAHVKTLNGLPVRPAHNRGDDGDRVKECPAWARPLIEQALRHFHML